MRMRLHRNTSESISTSSSLLLAYIPLFRSTSAFLSGETRTNSILEYFFFGSAAEESGEAEMIDKSHKVTVTAKSWDELFRKIDAVVMSGMADSMMTAGPYYHGSILVVMSVQSAGWPCWQNFSHPDPIWRFDLHLRAFAPNRRKESTDMFLLVFVGIMAVIVFGAGFMAGCVPPMEGFTL